MQKEKKNRLLISIIILLAILNFSPKLWDLYNQKRIHVGQLKNTLFLQQKLRKKSKRIFERYRQLPQAEKEYRQKIFKGENPEIVNSLMRTELNRIAQQHHILIRSMGLPKFSKADNWVLITQSLVFMVSQSKLIDFLKGLESSKYFLPIISLDIRVGEKDTLRCSMKIVGFSNSSQT